MTDPPPPGRIDLRAIDEPSDPTRVDRIVARALRDAVGERPVASVDLLSRLGELGRPVLAVAAAVILCATAYLRWADNQVGGTPVGSVSAWADARRVPTNGELLAAFKGYGR